MLFVLISSNLMHSVLSRQHGKGKDDLLLILSVVYTHVSRNTGMLLGNGRRISRNPRSLSVGVNICGVCTYFLECGLLVL